MSICQNCFLKMNVNLASKNILRNHCKFKNFINSLYISNTTQSSKWAVGNEFSTFTNQQSIVLSPKGENENKKMFQMHSRYLSEDSGPPSNKLPSLMPDFPKIVWPSLIKSIRNFILATFIIKPYLDKEFTLPSFIIGSKKAVEASFIYPFTPVLISFFITGCFQKTSRRRY